MLRYVIDYFTKKRTQAGVEKILVHTSIFFLHTLGIHTGYCFTGDIFGPYSQRISEDGDILEYRTGEVKSIHGFLIFSQYMQTPKMRTYFPLSTSLIQKIEKNLGFFCEVILKNDFSFTRVYMAGIVLHLLQLPQYVSAKTLLTGDTVFPITTVPPDIYKMFDLENMGSEEDIIAICNAIVRIRNENA